MLPVACVLNFITYDYAFCLYPKATLTYNTNLALKQPIRAVRLCLSKYAARGFNCIRVAGPDCRDWFYLDKVRWVKDRYAWHMKLPLLPNLSSSDDYTSPAITTTWSITTIAQDGHNIHFYVLLKTPTTFPLIFATDHIKVMISNALDLIHNSESDGSNPLCGNDG